MDKVHLLIIDPQQDFCDPHGALYVGGAEKDMERLAEMVKRLKHKFFDISVTLDSHSLFDIAHPLYWKDSAGNHPNPFTIITKDDVQKGVWTPSLPHLFKRSLDYVASLESKGRYALCIWPPHCLKGSVGQSIVPDLFNALLEWEELYNQVDIVTKGSNPFTEHYSGLMAEVPDPEDISTQLNSSLVSTLEAVDIIAIAGEASSHCVANTVRDLVNSFSNYDCAKKIVLLTDAMSPVGGFEQLQDDFFKEMASKGVQFSTTDKFLI